MRLRRGPIHGSSSLGGAEADLAGAYCTWVSSLSQEGSWKKLNCRRRVSGQLRKSRSNRRQIYGMANDVYCIY